MLGHEHETLELGGVGEAAHDGRARWAELGGEGEVQRLQRDLAAPAQRARAAADLRGGVARSLADQYRLGRPEAHGEGLPLRGLRGSGLVTWLRLGLGLG